MILFALLQRLFAFLSIGILAIAVWLVWGWSHLAWETERLGLEGPAPEQLYWGIGLVAFSGLGRLLILGLFGKGGRTAPPNRRDGAMEPGADGALLRLEVEGAAEGPIVLLTHGWGMSSRIWADTRETLSGQFGVVTWDLPGAGRSTRPRAGYSIDGFADDLKALIDRLPTDRPVVLVGHSIGGMTVQTLCLRHPALLHKRVTGVVLENTTYQNPLRTMIASRALTALQPAIELMLRLDILLSPLLWLINWQSYFSGSTHLAMRVAGFGSRPTWGHLDLASRLPTRTSPAVQARGTLAMLHWNVTAHLAELKIPTLVLVGGRDLVTKQEAGAFIASAVPGASLVRFADAGHMGPIEMHRQYTAAIADFVVGIGRSQRS